MQRSDLDAVAQLFSLANDGVDDSVWAQRFQEHIAKTMRQHSDNLTLQAGAIDQRLEVLRARLRLNEVVSERLEFRVARLDPELAEALQGLRTANFHLIDAALAPSEKQLPEASSSIGARAPAAMARRAGLAEDAKVQMRTPSPPIAENVMESVENISSRPPSGSQDQHPTGNKDRAAVGSNRPGKELSLRQLRSIIGSVYASKAAKDSRCIEQGEPLGTMEQHLYSWLSKRYHVQQLVEEWACAVLMSVQQWSAKECDVAVFGKILHNSLAESFAIVQDTLRATVQTHLRANLEERNSTATEAQLDELWRTWMRHSVPFSVCEKVVRHMYNELDSEKVLKRLRPVMAAASAAAHQEALDALSAPIGSLGVLSTYNALDPDQQKAVGYKDLLNTLLTFQMNITEAFLSDFRRFFMELDTDDDGILSGSELHELCCRIATLEGHLSSGVAAAAAQALQEAKTAATRAISELAAHRATYSESVELLTGLVGARWVATGGQLQEAPAG